jgi:hypothetical protein
MSFPIARLATRHIEGSPAVLACRRMARGYASANNRLDTTAGVFLLRHRLLQDREAVEYESDVHEHLRMSGFPVPAVLPFAAGERWLAAPGDTHVVPAATTTSAGVNAFMNAHPLLPLAGSQYPQESCPAGRTPVCCPSHSRCYMSLSLPVFPRHRA